MNNNSKPLTTDSTEVLKQLKSLETVIQKWSKDSNDLNEENQKLNENYRQLEEKYNKVLNENKRLAEQCDRLAKKLKTKQTVSTTDTECQTQSMVGSGDNEELSHRYNDMTEIYSYREETEQFVAINPIFGEKTVIGDHRRSDVLCDDSSEALYETCNDSDDPNDAFNENIDEIPESLDNSVDNKERNECDFEDIQCLDEIEDSFDANKGSESVENYRDFDSRYEKSDDLRIIESPIDGLNNETNARNEENLWNRRPNGLKSVPKSSEEKVIRVDPKAVKSRTLIPKSGGSTSPIKLVVKTLGPPVRGKSARKKLNGFSCKECEDYYRTKNLTEEQLKNKLNICSRHRSKFSPVKSPEHFWETDFPSTPECIRRGIFNVESNDTPFVTQRKKKSKQKLLPDFLRESDNKSQ